MTQNPHSFIDNVDLTVDVLLSAQWSDAVPSVEARIKECVFETLHVAQPDLLKKHTVEVTVSLSDNENVRQLNAKYRGKDKPTNVLSFANYEGAGWPSDISLPSSMPLLLGDIILAYGVIVSEAREQNKRFEAHLSHLVVHGCLHLLGYDHLNDTDAEEMEALEKKILFGLGIDNPYKDEEVIE